LTFETARFARVNASLSPSTIFFAIRNTSSRAAETFSRFGYLMAAMIPTNLEAAELEGQGFPSLRAGVARGAALSRAGDWYGRPVNLASRITDIAYPGSVLCSAEVREAAANGHRWSYAGNRRLKGISGVEGLFRVRRQSEEGSGG